MSFFFVACEPETVPFGNVQNCTWHMYIGQSHFWQCNRATWHGHRSAPCVEWNRCGVDLIAARAWQGRHTVASQWQGCWSLKSVAFLPKLAVLTCR